MFQCTTFEHQNAEYRTSATGCCRRVFNATVLGSKRPNIVLLMHGVVERRSNVLLLSIDIQNVGIRASVTELCRNTLKIHQYLQYSI